MAKPRICKCGVVGLPGNRKRIKFIHYDNPGVAQIHTENHCFRIQRTTGQPVMAMIRSYDRDVKLLRGN